MYLESKRLNEWETDRETDKIFDFLHFCKQFNDNHIVISSSRGSYAPQPVVITLKRNRKSSLFIIRIERVFHLQFLSCESDYVLCTRFHFN